jgi:uncharacterized membrane protein YjjB (DUF3815 family)
VPDYVIDWMFFLACVSVAGLGLYWSRRERNPFLVVVFTAILVGLAVYAGHRAVLAWT